jgi:G3E family GTPase
VILDSQPICFTGIEAPDIILALSSEGVARREKTISTARTDCLIVQEAGVSLPVTAAQIITFDAKKLRVSARQRALTAVALLVRHQSLVDMDMVRLGLKQKFMGEQLEKASGLVERVASS